MTYCPDFADLKRQDEVHELVHKEVCSCAYKYFWSVIRCLLCYWTQRINEKPETGWFRMGVNIDKDMASILEQRHHRTHVQSVKQMFRFPCVFVHHHLLSLAASKENT